MGISDCAIRWYDENLVDVVAACSFIALSWKLPRPTASLIAVVLMHHYCACCCVFMCVFFLHGT